MTQRGGVSYRVPKRLCPQCGYELDGVSPLEGDRKPTAGDVSICLKCATVLRFVDDVNQVLEDRPEVLNDPEILKVQAAARTISARAETGWKPLICCCCDGELPEAVLKAALKSGEGLKPGMVVICAYCANVIVLMKDGTFVPETDEEFLNSEAVVSARKFIQKSIDRRRSKTN